MHMLDIPMDSLPYGGRRAADSKHRSGLPPSFFFSSSSLSKHHERFPPSCVRTTSTACVGTHMSRIPTVPRHRRHLVGEPGEKTKDAPRPSRNASPPTPRRPSFNVPARKAHTRAITRFNRTRTKDGHVHPRARAPFCRAFSNGSSPFKTPRRLSAPLFTRGPRVDRQPNCQVR